MILVAIIGTREPDQFQRHYALRLALTLSRDFGVTIVTGAAYGIDHAAMNGAIPGKLIAVLPWASYNQDIVPGWAKKRIYDPKRDLTWTESVRRYHPAPDKLTRGAFALHARNYGIIHKTCLTIAMPDDKGGGGTAQGIRIAKDLSIPVMQFNRGGFMPSFEQVLNQAVSRLHLAA